MVETADVIAWIESRNRPLAQRFEVGVYRAYTATDMKPAQRVVIERIIAAHGGTAGCSLSTAAAIASTSYGLYQILGETLWRPTGLGLTSNVDFMGNTSMQRQEFDKFIAERGIAFTVEEMTGDDPGPTAKRQLFALRYNGPGMPDLYAARMAEAIARLAGNV